VVVWHSDQPPAVERTDILGQRFSRLGRPVGPAFRVNTTVTKEERNPAIVHDAKGNFVVVWQAYLDGVKVSILGRRFAASGAALSPEFEVFAGDNGLVPSSPDVAAVGTAGNFVVVWQNATQGVFGRRFTP
jgi:serralysin